MIPANPRTVSYGSSNNSASRAHKALTRLLEGAHEWGSLQVAPANRTGWSQYRLSVFPPGTSVPERRALTFARRWPILGAVVGVAGLLCLGGRVPVAPLSISLVAMYLAGFGTSAYLTRRVRPAVRTLVVSIVGYGDQAEIHGNSALLARQTNALDHMDDDVHSGLITPLEYEERWWEVYDEMPERAVATRRVSGRLAPRR